MVHIYILFPVYNDSFKAFFRLFHCAENKTPKTLQSFIRLEQNTSSLQNQNGASGFCYRWHSLTSIGGLKNQLRSHLSAAAGFINVLLGRV